MPRLGRRAENRFPYLLAWLLHKGLCVRGRDSVAVKEREESAVVTACEDARAFLKLEPSAQAKSDWYKSIREDRDARSFFVGPFRTSVGFGVAVARRVAQAYVDCVEDGEAEFGPTRKEADALKQAARTLDCQIERSPWVIEPAKSTSFRGPLKSLAEAPSTLPLRSSGRKPISDRRRFVVSLAQSIYHLTSGFHTGLLTVACLRGWENTDERRIRGILSDVKAEIITSVTTQRHAERFSEDGARDAITKLMTNSRQRHLFSNRSDGEKLSDAISALRSLCNAECGEAMIGSLHILAQEFGIELPERHE